VCSSAPTVQQSVISHAADAGVVAIVTALMLHRKVSHAHARFSFSHARTDGPINFSNIETKRAIDQIE